MELERFVGEIPEHPPAGIDLDDSGELVQLDLLARWSDTENEPDWSALGEAAAGALERSRDLRALVYLAGALLNTEGVRSFCDALALLRRYLEEHWDEVYPRLDGEDAVERSSAVLNLVNYHRIIRPLRRAALVEDRAAGRFSLEDIQIAQGKVEPPADYDGEPPQEALVLAAFQAMDGAELEALDSALARAIPDLDAIGEIFTERAGATASPDLGRLRATLAEMHAYTSARLGERSDAGATPEPGSAGAAAAQELSAPVPAQGADGRTAIRSRQEAVHVLDRVIEYFRVNEPSSPVPLLLERAKHLVDLDFMGIIEDIAPDAVAQARAIRGKAGQE
ncbi:type VI secretion system protein TssA [Sediminicurvatus halobius]|uniref:Type VI secretion system protein TssA n=1 Tax=Sediminicurvatus halobius TaxID=2182432 RepID=A0A2U2N2C5_9GAMM|nr:type VI secretion system protein TssA [Spiribacter halobius]PWG63260.1 type VI secretion system protein TssA [Spiribacter halobius]UEX76668.1 type VI secretion system protein TssA [Spiribacter halobius]